MLILSLIPMLAVALSPALVGERPAVGDAAQFRSPSGSYSAKVEYASGNTEFVPLDRFELLDRDGKTVFMKTGTRHTVLDISDNGLVVGVDFDGPVSGHARLHFYDEQGGERGVAEVGFWGQHGFSADGSTYCVLDGKTGLRVFTSGGRELYNAGHCNQFAVSGDGRHVALAADDAIRLLKDGTLAVSIPLATPFVRAMDFSSDGGRFGYCERSVLYVHRTEDAVREFEYRPADAKLRFISLDLGDRLTIAGLDLDGRRGTPNRHRRGLVVLLDSAGTPVGQQELTYAKWNFTVPEVRFGAAGTFRVWTAETELEYRY